MIRPTKVKALEKYKIWLRYSDGTEGEIDLIEFSGKGVFKYWDEGSVFGKVELGEAGQISWGDKVDLCPDTLYMRLTGKTPDELFPSLSKEEIDA